MWIDSHAHLDFPDLLGDLEQVLARARSSGVESILTVGCVGHNPGVCESVLRLVEDHPQVYAALGVHPHDASRWDDALAEEIAGHMSHPKVLAWGEIGLDYHYDNSPRPQQEKAFREQIRLAQAARKPIIVHTPEADEPTLTVLRQEYSGYDGPIGVLHCFTGGPEMARAGLEIGFHLGFGGILTFKRAEEVREVARDVPLDRILVETDSPYLAPVPHRGKKNEPAFVSLVGEMLAQVRGIQPQAAAEATSRNFRSLFDPSRKGAKAQS